MKISYCAYERNQTVHEMFMKTVYDVYFKRLKAGLVQAPWPPVKKNVTKMVLLSVFNQENLAEAKDSGAEEDGEEQEECDKEDDLEVIDKCDARCIRRRKFEDLEKLGDKSP